MDQKEQIIQECLKTGCGYHQLQAKYARLAQDYSKPKTLAQVFRPLPTSRLTII